MKGPAVVITPQRTGDVIPGAWVTLSRIRAGRFARDGERKRRASAADNGTKDEDLQSTAAQL
jgi:hypothetical protein